MTAMFLAARTPDRDLLPGALGRDHIRILGHPHEHLRGSADRRRYLQDDGAEVAVAAPTAVEADHVARQEVVREAVVVIKGEDSYVSMELCNLEVFQRGAEVQWK